MSSILNYTQVIEEVNHGNDFAHHAQRNIDQFLRIEVTAPEFYEKKQSKYIRDSQSLIDSSLRKLEFIEQHTINNDEKITQTLLDLTQGLEEYKELSNIIMQKYLYRGFKDWGAVGEFRKRAHILEGEPLIDQILLLTLRRHEKDFFLRGDTDYVVKFDQKIEELTNHIISTYHSGKYPEMDESKTKNILAKLVAYQYGFKQVVKIEQELGLNDNQGLNIQLQHSLSFINDSYKVLKEEIEAQSKEAMSWSLIGYITIITIQLIVSIFIGVGFTKKVANRVISLANLIKLMAEGDLTEIEINDYHRDEIAKAFQVLDLLNRRIKTATNFVEKIGTGQLDVHYKEEFKEGILAKHLIQMQDNLKNIQEKDAVRRWVTDGVTEFVELLMQNENEHTMCEILISELVKYTNANQGGIFFIKEEEDNSVFSLTASYAYEKKKFNNYSVQLDEGLLGQIYKERRTMIFDSVPDGYVNITSGLGAATPKYLLIVPLLSGNEIFGVIELASFLSFEEHHVSLMEQVADRLANVVRNNNINQQRKQMIAQMNEQTETMMMHEAELKHQISKMEDLERQHQKQEALYEEEIKKLKDVLKEHNIEPHTAK